MAGLTANLMIICVLLSVCCTMTIVVRFFLRRLRAVNYSGRDLIPLLLLFAAVWSLRLGVDLYSGCLENPAGTLTRLDFWEDLVNSAIHALQSFSMDEDYTEYQLLGKQMVFALSGGNQALTGLYSVYATLLNISAPIGGGAVLLDILANIFPSLAVTLKFWRRKVFFSELNNGSVQLAESILMSEQKGLLYKPMIIFADAYVNETDESSSELYYAAKKLGAICLEKDIIQLNLGGIREKRIILNDVQEISNLNTLAELCSQKHFHKLKHTAIYLFYEANEYTSLETDISKQLDANCLEAYRKGILRKQKKFLRKAVAAQTGNRRLISGTPEEWAEILANHRNREKLEEADRMGKRLMAEEERLLRWKLNPESEEYQQTAASLQAETGKAPSKAEVLSAWKMKALQAHSEAAKKLEQYNQEDKRNDIAKILEEYRMMAESYYLPAIIRIRVNKNMADRLLQQVPLYIPLLSEHLDSKEPRKLHLAVLGAGSLAMELIRSASWYGQMYDALQISVVSMENRDEIAAHLCRSSPEFLKSAGDPETLAVYQDGLEERYNAPYFHFSYGQYDLQYCDLQAVVCKDWYSGAETALLDADYYMVILGSDELNIKIADELRRLLSIRRFPNKDSRELVIAYSVFSPEMNAVCTQWDKDRSYHIRMVPFGSLSETYSGDNILGAAKRSWSELAQKGYRKISNTDAYLESRERLKGSYNYESSLARYSHLHYRMFSTWRFLQQYDPAFWPDFEKDGHPDYNTYKRAILAEEKPSWDNELYDYLTWLEHRRWNAYLRSIGYTHIKKGKDHNLRIHECLVECLPGPQKHRKDRLDQLNTNLVYKVYDTPCDTDCSLLEEILGQEKNSPRNY